MLSLSVNGNNDIFLTNDGNIATSTDIDACLVACACAAKAQLGEMIYAADQGLPTFQTVWNGVRNIPQYELYLRQAILVVENVQEITNLTLNQVGDILTYQITIKTDFGSGVINGGF